MNDGTVDQSPVEQPAPCPNCGKPLPSGAPAGLCPACLLEQGAETVTSDPTRPGRFEPLPLEEVARLFPQLEITGLIGAGGMGAVYRARQPALDRQVALKILPPHGHGSVSFAERFNREARALARLSHPNIVAVHEFGQVQGLHYFIMEFVDGANLRQLEKTGRLSPREALQIVPQICDALQYAHDEGVVHRDIKPENVLVDRRGRVKIADFGLAKILGIEGEDLRSTAEGQVMGTPHYMAPEQVERPMSVDHRADIYSLGVVLYEMLTGDLPLGNFAPPSRKVEVDVRFDEVVLRALENDPARRYQHASEVKSRVETIREVPAPPTTPPVPIASAAPAPRFSRAAIVGAGWAPLFFLMGLLWLTPMMQTETNAGVPALQWWQWGLLFTLLPLGLTAPFGTTILGWVSVTQIRRSGGQLYGLGLALFDGLVFPLLLLDLVLGVLVLRGGATVGRAIGASPPNQLWPVFVGLVALGLCAAANVYVARKLWRMVNRPGVAEAPGRYTPRRQMAYGLGGLAAVIAVVAIVSALSNGPLYRFFHRGNTRLADTDAASGAFVARLPRGGTIELLGVSDPDPAPNGWWRPDGSPLADQRIEVTGLGEATGPNAQLKNLILRYQHLPEGASFPSIEFVPPAAYSGGGRVRLEDQPLAGSLPVRVAFPADLRTATMRVGLDWEPWQLSMTHDPRAQSSVRTRRPGDPSWEAAVHQVSDDNGSAQVTVMLGRDDPNWKTRVIAVDTNGVEHAYSRGSGTPVGTMQAWTYVYPLYAYARRRTSAREEAEDLVQAFFERFLAKNYLAGLDSARGRFRAFLLASLKHFLANEWEKARRQKRGGGVPLLSLDWERAGERYHAEPADPRTPEHQFDREWALALLDRVIERLEAECRAGGKGRLFETAKVFLTLGTEAIPYAKAAADLGLEEGALRVAIHRLRKRYHELLRDEIAQTLSVCDSSAVEEELRSLRAALTDP